MLHSAIPPFQIASATALTLALRNVRVFGPEAGSAGPAVHGNFSFPSSSTMKRLDGAAMREYGALLQDLDALERGDISDGFDPGAARSARVVIQALFRAKAIAPKMTWHGDDAVVFLWAHDEVVRAMTITDGEYSVVERADGRLISRYRPAPISDGTALFTG